MAGAEGGTERKSHTPTKITTFICRVPIRSRISLRGICTKLQLEAEIWRGVLVRAIVCDLQSGLN